MKLCTSCHQGLLGAPAHCPLCGTNLTAVLETSGDELVGMRVAEHYVLAELVGEGAMGWVYRGVHQTLDRSVAVKLLKIGEQEEATAVARFDQEARTVSRIHHPHIVSIIDYGRTPGGLLYLITEFLLGGTLSDLLALEGWLPVNRVLAIFHQVLAAVEEAHWANVIHRDLKPDNIVVSSLRSGGDFVKVLDFGIAAMADEATEKESVYAGTPGFMAPEMISDGVADARSDVYALGAILFEMLTGEPPFKDSHPIGLLSMHLNDAPPLLRSIAPDRGLPAEMEEAVARALAKAPADRYASVADLRADILSAFSCMGTAHAGCEECTRPRDPLSGLCDLHGGAVQPTPYPPASSPRIDVTSRTLVAGRSPDKTRLLGRLSDSGCLPDDAAAIVDFFLGDAKLMEVVGPTAANRERLVEGAAIVAELLDLRVLRLRPDHRGALRPWYPVRRMVGEILGSGPDPASATTLHSATGPLKLERRHVTGLSLLYGLSTREAPEGRRDRHAAILRGVNAVLRDGLSGHAGVCVLVDSVGELDRASQRFVRHLEATARAPQVKIFASSDVPFWPHEDGRQLLRPSPFDTDAVGALLDRVDLRGDTDKRVLASRIAAACGGLSFHAEQAVAVFREGGDFSQPLKQLVGWRLGRLPADAVDVLRVVCAIGDEVDLATLGSLVDDDVAMLAVDMLIRAGLLHSSPERSLSASRAALRRVVLETLDSAERVALHRRIFAALQKTGASPFILAHHAFEGEMDETAFTLLEEVGDRACIWTDEETAAQVHYRHAVHVARWRMLMAEGDLRYLSLSLKLAEVLLDTGHDRAAEVTLKEVLGNANPDGELAQRARAALDRLGSE